MTNRYFMNRLLLACFGVAFAASAQAGGVRQVEELDHVPTGKGHGEYHGQGPHRVQSEPNSSANGSSSGRQTSSAVTYPQHGIFYHGGPVLGAGSPVNVYYIWYGNWTGNSAASILEPLAANLSGTPLFNTNTTYTNSAGTPIANHVVFKQATNNTYGYAQGVSLSDTAVKNIVANSISTHALPLDSSGVYFVLTSKDVKESSGFCTKYCGWHTAANISGQIVQYAFVGDPSSQCPNSCSVQGSKGPNGNPGADAMASVIVHELEEATTDPWLNAWYDSAGAENADKCAWTFGTVSVAGNGAKYNVNIGGLNYLIQQNWVNAGSGYCAMAF